MLVVNCWIGVSLLWIAKLRSSYCLRVHTSHLMTGVFPLSAWSWLRQRNWSDAGKAHFAGINNNLQILQVLFERNQHFPPERGVRALRHQVLDDLGLARFLVNAVFLVRFDENNALLRISRALDHVAVSVRAAVLQAEEAERRPAGHRAPQGTAAFEINESLTKKVLQIVSL